MKDTILSALKAKFEGVSDSILSRMADKLAKTAHSTDDVATLTEGVTWQTLIESYGDSRATEAQITAVTNYEKKHNLKNGEKVAQQQQQQADPATPSWAQSLADEIKRLNERVAAYEGEKTATARRSKFDATIEKLPEALRKPYTRIPITDLSEEEFATLLTEVGGEVENLVKETASSGAIFGTPRERGGQGGGGSKGAASDAEVDAVVASMKL